MVPWHSWYGAGVTLVYTELHTLNFNRYIVCSTISQGDVVCGVVLSVYQTIKGKIYASCWLHLLPLTPDQCHTITCTSFKSSKEETINDDYNQSFRKVYTVYTMCWIYPATQDASHHQDDYISSISSRTKPALSTSGNQAGGYSLDPTGMMMCIHL